MGYLIDGNNLIGRASAADLRDPAGREGWIRRLIAFQRFTRRRVVLVFDGRPPDELPVVEVGPKFTIVYSDVGRSADDVIEELLSSGIEKRHLEVVSSDRRIRDAARRHGARAVTSDEFLRALKGALRQRRAAREMAKTEESPTSLEVRLWGEVFRKGR